MLSLTVDGVAYPVPSSAADTNWAAQQVAFEQAVAAAVNKALAAPTWVNATLINNWVNSGGSDQTAQYYKDPTGRVWFRADIFNSFGGGSGTVCTQLPAGFRPPKDLRFVIYTQNGVGSASINSATGDVTLIQLTGNIDTRAALNFSFSTVA